MIEPIQRMMMFNVIGVWLISLAAIGASSDVVQRCARAAGSCILAPRAMEGPYYWNSTVRRDITEGKAGVPLRLTINVLDTRTCSPLSNAVVDLWHCDTGGVYSHFIGSSLGQNNRGTDNSTFLRGQQVTNAQGTAVFDTVYPGWYPGRATHLHVKVHVGASLTNLGGAIIARGGHVSHTGQLFFDDTVSDQVARLSPYSSQTSQRIRNNQDGIYSGSGGSTMVVPIQSLSSNGLQGGVSGQITLGVDPNAVVTSGGGGGGDGGRPPRPGR